MIEISQQPKTPISRKDALKIVSREPLQKLLGKTKAKGVQSSSTVKVRSET